MAGSSNNNPDEAAGYYQPNTSTGEASVRRSSKSSMVFAILLILFEILFCLITGILYRLSHSILTSLNDFGGVLLVCILTILTVIGKFLRLLRIWAYQQLYLEVLQKCSSIFFDCVCFGCSGFLSV